MAVIVEQSRYILADITTNKNKFWNIELYDNGDCITHWGRVGECGQSKHFASAGDRFFAQKCREKEGKGYTPLRTLEAGVTHQSSVPNVRLEIAATEQIQTNGSEAAQLVARLTRANIHNILSRTTMQYDTSKGVFSTPLGIVTEDAIAEARRLLTRIAEFVNRGEYDNRLFVEAANQYLMLVPKNIGRQKPNLPELYPDLEAVQTQNGILDALEVSLQNVVAATPEEQRIEERLFDVALHRVEAHEVIERIRCKFRSTMQAMHACAHLDVKAVYAVDIASMRQDFETKGRLIGNVWELWHGTRIANLLSILKSGLRVAPPRSAHVTGKMFGNGTYFSDQSTKSLNYAYGYWNGERNDNCFMLLCDVAMGKHYTPASYTEPLPRPDYDSTFARAGLSGVANNEMIVYTNHQVNIRYLVEFDRPQPQVSGSLFGKANAS